jgi:trans-aconitate methyltransferase
VTEPYHPYVFDTERRKFVGDFEGMYQAELEGNFDSWHQSDPRRLDASVSALLLERISYATAVDLACGKGHFTARLKRLDNHVVGVDMSETAISVARSHFPDLEWVCAPISEYLEGCAPVDLMLARQALSYLEDWREVLEKISGLSRYLCVDTFIPDDPIGFVPSHAELQAELERHFDVIESVMLPKRQISVYLCGSLQA